MHEHKIFIKCAGLRIDTVDPHGPWQRGHLERHRLLSIDLSICFQDELNVIALSLNMHPRTCIDFFMHNKCHCYNIQRTLFINLVWHLEFEIAGRQIYTICHIAII